MKTIIKILIVLVVVAAIALAVIYFMTGLGTPPPPPPPPTPFEQHIQTSAENGIKHKAYGEASLAFDDILGEIQTERSVILGNGLSGINEQEEANCNKIAFYAYVPIFMEYSKNYFRLSAWEDSVLMDLRQRAELLLSMGVSESGTTAEKSLNNTIQYVSYYYEALEVIKEADKCTTVKGASSLIRKADNYCNLEPLKNNTELVSGLKSVPSKAKNSCANYILRQCNNVVQNWRVYDSYEDFYASYDRVSNLIDNYKQQFGKTNFFDDVLKQLDSVDKSAMEYYVSSKQKAI